MFSRVFARRAFSQLIKSEVPASVTKVATSNKSYYELQAYSQDELKAYFDQEALLIPVETIIEKTAAHDFKFFLTQGNFLKVVDTLEKFEQGCVDKATPAGKEFVLFKRQLYQMYEVSNRSADEHEAFTFRVERSNLTWLYSANLDFIEQKSIVNFLETRVDCGQLKGAVFKRKMMSDNRLKAVGSFAATFFTWFNLMPLTLVMGPTLPAVGMAAGLLYGMHQCNEQNQINEIRVIKEGDNAGRMLMSIQKSPFVTHQIIACPKHVKSLVALGHDDLGHDDVDSNLVMVSEYEEVATGEVMKEPVAFCLPADAYRNKEMVEWILSVSGEEDTSYDSFNELMVNRFEATEPINGLAAYEVHSTGLANQQLPDQIEHSIETDALLTESNLIEMQSRYGKDNLEQMDAREFYKLYARFVAKTD